MYEGWTLETSASNLLTKEFLPHLVHQIFISHIPSDTTPQFLQTTKISLCFLTSFWQSLINFLILYWPSRFQVHVHWTASYAWALLFSLWITAKFFALNNSWKDFVIINLSTSHESEDAAPTNVRTDSSMKTHAQWAEKPPAPVRNGRKWSQLTDILGTHFDTPRLWLPITAPSPSCT